MKSRKNGTSTSKVEVQNISKHGIWLFVKEKEFFLPFQDFPWFSSANVKDIYKVELNHGHHLHWPNLDVDLELESLESLGNYPNVYK